MMKSLATSIGNYLALLGPKARSSFKKVVLAQSVLGILDLIGVAAIGVIASLTLKGVQSNQPGGRTQQVLEFLSLKDVTFQSQVIVLSLLATFFLILKTFLTVILNRKILFFLSFQASNLADKLLAKVLATPILRIQSNSSQEIQYAIGTGTSAIALGIVGTSATAITDASGLLILLAGLLVIDPVVAVSSILLFGLIGFFTFKLTHQKADRLGQSLSKLNIKTHINVQELIGSYREIYIRNRREFYLWRVSKIRNEYASTLAEQTFMPNIPKYILEVSVLIGALLMAGLEFSIHDASHAAASLSIFIVAGSRIAPALLRLQQSLVQIRTSQGVASSTYELILKFSDQKPLESNNAFPKFEYPGFQADISISNVSFKYPDNGKVLFEDLNLKVDSGQFVAIAGHSGSGKSTLVDLLLGLHMPSSGEILISGKKPIEIINTFPGVIGYVPQVIGLIDGSIRENLALGFDCEQFSEQEYWRALEQAQLTEFVSSLHEGLNFKVGEGGSKLSGGQRQRLGIARALLTKPKLLILDEATSALDSQTELEISNSIHSLHGEVTTVMIAHRLSTIKLADIVIYLEEGIVRSKGTFEQVRSAVPNFEIQAGLQGQ